MNGMLAFSTTWALVFKIVYIDHIGHLAGPDSRLMKPKQKEMDKVVETIVSILRRKDKLDRRRSLFVLSGDHGMNEIGNHGGAGNGETSTAMVFILPSENFHHKHPYKAQRESTFDFYPNINQVDLVPTISYLFGVPIPKNNLGRIVSPLIKNLSFKVNGISEVYQANALQLKTVLDTSFCGKPSCDKNVIARSTFPDKTGLSDYQYVAELYNYAQHFDSASDDRISALEEVRELLYYSSWPKQENIFKEISVMLT